MNRIDRVISEIDAGLRTLFAAPYAERSIPTGAERSITVRTVTSTEFEQASAEFEQACAAKAAPSDGVALSDTSKQESMRLMRINHAGEVCAQALYQGQAMVARNPETRDLLEQAAREERDHLAWCHTRIAELNGNTSRLTPFFYAGSFALGAISGLLGDKWSMGFLVETERQVEAHLSDHLERLSTADERSRQILEGMRADEIHHAQTGLDHGAAELPGPIKSAMRGVSKAMTSTAYWV